MEEKAREKKEKEKLIMGLLAGLRSGGGGGGAPLLPMLVIGVIQSSRRSARAYGARSATGFSRAFGLLNSSRLHSDRRQSDAGCSLRPRVENRRLSRRLNELRGVVDTRRLIRLLARVCNSH